MEVRPGYELIQDATPQTFHRGPQLQGGGKQEEEVDDRHTDKDSVEEETPYFDGFREIRLEGGMEGGEENGDIQEERTRQP